MMRLIGMLDSPYVRRVAISLTLFDIPFEHENLSVFRDFAAFSVINPVVKAPSLVLRDSTVLMDSSLILEAIEPGVPLDRRLTPSAIDDVIRCKRILGLALAACEKTVQIAYERNLRPAEKQHQPWLDRIGGQLACAFRLLEAEYATVDDWMFGDRPMQSDVTTAVAWRFAKSVLPEPIFADAHPSLTGLSARAEALPAFVLHAFN